jgi:hypothetical protein
MARTSQPKKPTRSQWWRTLLTGICIVLAGAAVLGSIATRYLRDNLLNTDAYVAIVANLPQQPEVATALTTFTTDRLFDQARTEARIRAFLPRELSALAGPLAQITGQKVSEVTKRFVQSDTFTAIWITVNRLAQSGVVAVADSNQTSRQEALQSVRLEPLLHAVRQQFDGNTPVLSQQQLDRAATLRVDLQQSIQQLRTNVRLIRTGAYVLPYVAAALILLAIALAHNRRTTFIHMGITFTVFGVAALIACKLFSNNALSTITDPTYRAAGEVIYEAFYHNLRLRLGALTGIGIALAIAALACGPYTYMERAGNWFRDTTLYQWLITARQFTARYELWFVAVGLIGTAIWLLTLSHLTPSILLVIVSLLAIYLATVHIVARPAPSNRHLVS